MASQAPAPSPPPTVVDPCQHGVRRRRLVLRRQGRQRSVVGLRVVHQRVVGLERLDLLVGGPDVVPSRSSSSVVPGQRHDDRRGGGDREEHAVGRAAQRPGHERQRGVGLGRPRSGVADRGPAVVGPGDHARSDRAGRRATLGVEQAVELGPEGVGVRWDRQALERGADDRIGVHLHVAHRTSSPSTRRSAARARCRREATVPGATPRISAASRWSNPSPSTSTTVTRWSTGSSASACRTVSDALTIRSGPGRLDSGSTGSSLETGDRLRLRSSSMHAL